MVSALLLDDSDRRSLTRQRFCAGMAESGFFPLVIYYLTTFYRRAELARRLALFYAASNIANAFSGLLAFAVFRKCTPLKHKSLSYSRSALDIEDGRLPAWRYLFLIEGGATVLCT